MGHQMLLNRDEIMSNEVIRNGAESAYRAASYDLRVGRILTTSGEEKTTFIIPPQGMVDVISQERVILKGSIAGYATVKTSLCRNGILAINIGIIDPGYEGLISSTLINFSKCPFALRAGDPFLRLTFHQYTAPRTLPAAPSKGDEEYVQERKKMVQERFSATFLDVPQTIENLTPPLIKRVLDDWKSALYKWAPLFAFVIALLAFLVNVGATRFGQPKVSKEQLKAEVVAEIRDENHRIFEERLQQVERQTQQLLTEREHQKKVQ